MTTRTIKTLKHKMVNTQYGEKAKWLITFEESPNQLIDSFVGNWNKNWKIGTKIEIKPEQIQSRQWEGKTYYTLKAPPEARFGGVSKEAFDILVERVDTIEKTLKERWNAELNG